MNTLAGKTIIYLVEDGYHDAETLIPAGYFANHGAQVLITSLDYKNVKAYNNSITLRVQKKLSEINPNDIDCLLIAGGTASAILMNSDEVLQFVRDVDAIQVPICTICSAARVTAAADVIKNKTITGWIETVKEPVSKAGARYVDKPLVRDGHFISSRIPDDLEYFCTEIHRVLDQPKILKEKGVYTIDSKSDNQTNVVY